MKIINRIYESLQKAYRGDKINVYQETDTRFFINVLHQEKIEGMNVLAYVQIQVDILEIDYMLVTMTIGCNSGRLLTRAEPTAAPINGQEIFDLEADRLINMLQVNTRIALHRVMKPIKLQLVTRLFKKSRMSSKQQLIAHYSRFYEDYYEF